MAKSSKVKVTKIDDLDTLDSAVESLDAALEAPIEEKPPKKAKKAIDPVEVAMEEQYETQAVVEDKPDFKEDKVSKKRWYIVHVYSGHENKVKINLEKRIEYMDMGDKIFRVEVPQKTVTHVKAGKKTEKDEKIFPGYVLVEMIMSEDSWYVVRHTAGVTKFVGSAKRPIPAKESEIKRIIHRGQSTVQKIELDVKVGDKVRISSGPFADFIGDITEVYPDKAKLRATVSIFGRETPVELEYKQIQKV